jgi:rhodanese-related sulfurtransferase
VIVDIEELLYATRTRLERLTAQQASLRQQEGAMLVDIRPEFQRRAEGEIPQAIVIERNHLEWRCDPCSDARIQEATDHDVSWIVVCGEGFSSSLAAASLQQLGLHNATDVIGGFLAWRAAGLPVVHPDRPTDPRAPTS